MFTCPLQEVSDYSEQQVNIGDVVNRKNDIVSKTILKIGIRLKIKIDKYSKYILNLGLFPTVFICWAYAILQFYKIANT